MATMSQPHALCPRRSVINIALDRAGVSMGLSRILGGHASREPRLSALRWHPPGECELATAATAANPPAYENVLFGCGTVVAMNRRS